MRQYCFSVRFHSGPSITVMAFNKEEAIILAQAERIKVNLDYRNVKEVVIID